MHAASLFACLQAECCCSAVIGLSPQYNKILVADKQTVMLHAW
jgi:hypothetical protein